LLLTDVPAVFEVGAFSLLGVASITVVSLVGLPAALARLPLRAAPDGAGHALAHRLALRLDDALGALALRAERHSGRVLVGAGLLVLGAAWAIPRIVIDTDYLSFFPPDAQVRRDFESVNRLLAGAVPFYVVLDGEPGAFREPEALRALERIQAGAERIPGVSRTLSLADTLRVMNRALSRDDPAAERVPDGRGEVAELVFMAPKGDLDRYTNVNHARANVLVRTGAVGTASVRETTARLEAAVEAAEVPPSLEARVTGNAILLSHSADGIARGQPRTVGLAALCIFVLVAMAFRSPRLGAVAMVPNLVPVAAFFGVLGLGVAPLSLPTSLIGSVALGIAVDDTAHFLVRYGSERRRGLDPAAAAALCGRRVGRPIAITSVMLMAGFAVVGLSGFATLREFGWLSAATMGFCLVSDLVLLPALLVRTRA
jgi:predicted RND superfamily exporter protein